MPSGTCRWHVPGKEKPPTFVGGLVLALPIFPVRARIVLCRPGHAGGMSPAKKNLLLSQEVLCWRYLFSRPVTRQVSSAQMSLTSVFGMGTGGPSPQSTPTHVDGSSPSFMSKRFRSNHLENIAPFPSLVNPFLRSFSIESPTKRVSIRSDQR